MRKSLEQLNKAIELSEAGKHFAVVDYLSKCSPEEIEQSPTLALLLGSAHARLGKHVEGQRLVEVALATARERGDRLTELRALNARGAIALATGRVDEAEEFFTRGADAAKRQGDHATVGRCFNNLGIIEHYRGRYDEALSSYNLAQAAFQQAGSKHGVAEAEHNVGITYRDRGELDQAFKQSNRAVEHAKETGDRSLHALALAVQAEIRALSGDADLARLDIDEALEVHRQLDDEPAETGDLRILARVVATAGDPTEAERLLGDVIRRSEDEQRPRITAAATRDLAGLLASSLRDREALETARAARVLYDGFGAHAEIKKLDELIANLR